MSRYLETVILINHKNAFYTLKRNSLLFSSQKRTLTTVSYNETFIQQTFEKYSPCVMVEV